MRRILRAVAVALACGCASVPEGGGAGEALDLDAFAPQGWDAAGPTDRYVGAELYNPIDGYADYYMGFAFLDAQRRYYRRGSGEIEVFLYRFQAPAEAYGAWTVMRPAAGEPAGVGAAGACDGSVLAAWKGSLFATVSGQGDAPPSAEELVAVGRALLDPVGGATEPPPLMAALPEKGRIPATEVYFHFLHPFDRVYHLGENVFLLGEDPENHGGPEGVKDVAGVFGIYEGARKDEISIIALRYRDEDLSRRARTRAMEFFAKGARSWKEQGPWSEIQTRRGRAVAIFQSGRYLVCGLPARDAGELKSLVARVVRGIGAELADRG